MIERAEIELLVVCLYVVLDETGKSPKEERHILLIKFFSNKGTFPDVGVLFNRDFMYLIHRSELCLR